MGYDISIRTTPAQVRSELKRRGAPYGISKAAQCWYVTGGDSSEWQATSLNTYDFKGRPAAWWADLIQGMASDHLDEKTRHERAFITISGEDKIGVHIGIMRWAFQLNAEGCREAARFLKDSGVKDWGYSSSVDHRDEYEHLFDRNVGDVIEEEFAKI